MRIIRDFSSCPPDYKGAAIALGNFDGVHLGHQAILRRATQTARQHAIPSAVMCFEPHPREFFAPMQKKLRISSFHSKMDRFAALGIDAVYLVRFNAAFAALSAEAFVGEVLCKNLGVRHVITGHNFAFGKNRGGNTDFLARQSGFEFYACDAVHDASGATISSSAIREGLAAGDVKKAAILLGRPYTIDGHVRHGQKNGRTLGFPTANLAMGRLFIPRYGVYAVRFYMDGKEYNGVANLGVRPTFGDTQPVFEVHGFDMDENLYGKRITVALMGFLREEQKFASLDHLKAQIGEDCRRAKQLLQEAMHA